MIALAKIKCEREPKTSEPSADGDRGPLPLLLTADQAARLVGLGKRTLWRLTSAGQFPAAIRIGGATRWRRVEVESWVDAL